MQRLQAFLEDNVVAIMVIAIVVLIAIGSIAWTLVAQARWDRDVSESNVRALQDTVRVYQGIAQGLEGELGERTRAATLMQEQLTINSDSIRGLGTALGVASAALQLSQRALSRAEVAFDSLIEDIEVDSIIVVEETGDRIATFTVEGPPIEGTAKVIIPPEISLRPILFQPALTVSRFGFTYALGCTPQLDAVVTFESPSWVRMIPQPGIVAPEICHGDRPTLGQGFKVSLGNFVIGAGVGATITAILFGVLGGG